MKNVVFAVDMLVMPLVFCICTRLFLAPHISLPAHLLVYGLAAFTCSGMGLMISTVPAFSFLERGNGIFVFNEDGLLVARPAVLCSGGHRAP